jgi:hypothetical protein
MGSLEEPKGVLPMEGINEVQGKTEKTRPPRGGAARRSIRSHVHSHPFEVRRKAVQLCLEESFPVQLVACEMGGKKTAFSGGIGCRAPVHF